MLTDLLTGPAANAQRDVSMTGADLEELGSLQLSAPVSKSDLEAAIQAQRVVLISERMWGQILSVKFHPGINRNYCFIALGSYHHIHIPGIG